MKYYHLLIFTTILCSACQTSNIESQTFVESGIDVSAMHSYSWESDKLVTMLGPLYGLNTSILEGRLKSNTQRMLTAKGYQYVDRRQDADFVVSFGAGTGEQLILNRSSNTNIHASNPQEPQLTDSVQAGVSLVLKSPEKQILWMGTAIDRLNNRDAERLVVSLLEKIFEDFPSASR